MVQLYGYFNSIFGGLQEVSKKVYSAVNFIDYFVHDILDYTILTKEDATFIKN